MGGLQHAANDGSQLLQWQVWVWEWEVCVQCGCGEGGGEGQPEQGCSTETGARVVESACVGSGSVRAVGVKEKASRELVCVHVLLVLWWVEGEATGGGRQPSAQDSGQEALRRAGPFRPRETEGGTKGVSWGGGRVEMRRAHERKQQWLFVFPGGLPRQRSTSRECKRLLTRKFLTETAACFALRSRCVAVDDAASPRRVSARVCLRMRLGLRRSALDA